MVKFLPHHNTKNIQDVLLQGFDAKDTAFINWETITKKGNNALKEAERKIYMKEFMKHIIMVINLLL